LQSRKLKVKIEFARSLCHLRCTAVNKSRLSSYHRGLSWSWWIPRSSHLHSHVIIYGCTSVLSQPRQWLENLVPSPFSRTEYSSGCFFQSDNGQKLYDAARFGDVDTLEALLSQRDTDINYRAPVSVGEFYSAMFSSNGLNQVQRCMMTQSGRTALHLAVQKGHKDVLLLLLRRGANASVRDLVRANPSFLCSFSSNHTNTLYFVN
jgi:hypothetical protein